MLGTYAIFGRRLFQTQEGGRREREGGEKSQYDCCCWEHMAHDRSRSQRSAELGGCPSEGGWRGTHPPLLHRDSMANAAGLAVQGSGEGPGTRGALEDAGNGRQSELSWSQNPRWAGGLM